jgi:uncharacterized protein
MSETLGEFKLQLDSPTGRLDGVLVMPARPVAQLVLAHGAGAGFEHKTMRALAQSFAEVGLGSLRFNFPFMQKGQRRVDSNSVATQTIALAFEYLQHNSALPVLLAGHSFGGRMCSHAVLEHGLACDGLIYCSFPLHPPKKKSVTRAAHLVEITQPQLFVSGTRDDLADKDLLSEVVSALPRAQIHWLETANHSYTILKRTRTNPTPVFEEIAQRARLFVDEVI